MKKFIALLALALVSVGAQAAPATYFVTGTTWTSSSLWDANANGDAQTNQRDNGEAAQSPLFGGVSSCGLAPNSGWTTGGIWDTPFPPNSNGTYVAPYVVQCGSDDAAPSAFGLGSVGPTIPDMSGTMTGTIEYETTTGEVTGGSLTLSGGSISDDVVVSGESKWMFEYTAITIDFAAGTATGTGTCWEHVFVGVGQGFAPCFAVAVDPSADFATSSGNETEGGDPVDNPTSGTDGAFHYAAFFNGTDTLEMFNEGRAECVGCATGSDTLKSFNVVPIPAAVWLFGSALGLLGFARRKA